MQTFLKSSPKLLNNSKMLHLNRSGSFKKKPLYSKPLMCDCKFSNMWVTMYRFLLNLTNLRNKPEQDESETIKISYKVTICIFSMT